MANLEGAVLLKSFFVLCLVYVEAYSFGQLASPNATQLTNATTIDLSAPGEVNSRIFVDTQASRFLLDSNCLANPDIYALAPALEAGPTLPEFADPENSDLKIAIVPTILP